MISMPFQCSFFGASFKTFLAVSVVCKSVILIEKCVNLKLIKNYDTKSKK